MQAARVGQRLGMFQRLLEIAAVDDSSAPWACIAAFFSRLLPSGTTITGVRPLRRAAVAMAWPWLPRVAAITPSTAGSVRRSRSM